MPSFVHYMKMWSFCFRYVSENELVDIGQQSQSEQLRFCFFLIESGEYAKQQTEKVPEV